MYFGTQDENHKVIQITSPNPGDGKTTLAANLAVSIADSGKRVLLIDADFRRPKVHKYFGLDNAVGVSTVIAGEAEIPDAIRPTAVENLSAMPCGPRPHNPADLLTSPRFKEMIDLVREQYDFVIVDTPPLLAVTDPSVVAPRVDGVLMVLRLSKHARDAAMRATELSTPSACAPSAWSSTASARAPDTATAATVTAVTATASTVKAMVTVTATAMDTAMATGRSRPLPTAPTRITPTTHGERRERRSREGPRPGRRQDQGRGVGPFSVRLRQPRRFVPSLDSPTDLMTQATSDGRNGRGRQAGVSPIGSGAAATGPGEQASLPRPVLPRIVQAALVRLGEPGSGSWPWPTA